MHRTVIVFALCLLISSTAFAVDRVVHLPGDGNANDASGNGNNATLLGNATFAAGRIDQAFDLDGNNDAANVGPLPFLNQASTFSASAWFFRRVDGGSATNHNVNNIIFANSSTTSNDNFELGTDGGNIEVYLDTQGQDGPNPVSYAAGVVNNAWHQVTITYDSAQTDEVKIYLDGALVASDNQWGGNLDQTINGNPDSPLSIGLARPNQSNFGDFNGLIDDPTIWNEALSEGEAIALFNLGDALGIAADEAEQLFDLHDGDIVGPVVIDGQEWVQIPNGLVGGLGQLDENADGFQLALQLDASGSGVGIAAAVPEPSTVAIWTLLGSLAGAVVFWRWKRR